jgi:hypothetical protein
LSIATDIFHPFGQLLHLGRHQHYLSTIYLQRQVEISFFEKIVALSENFIHV